MKVIILLIVTHGFKETEKVFQITLIYIDSIIIIVSFGYLFFVLFMLLTRIHAKFRFEFKRHIIYLATVTFAMLLCVPFDILYMKEWMDLSNEIESERSRLAYYGSNIAKLVPTLLILFVKPNEDCFNCFNRLAPERYSYFQYSISNLLNKRLSMDE